MALFCACLCVHAAIPDAVSDREIDSGAGLDAENRPTQVPDVVYTNWLLMVRAGVLGLEYFTPESKTWRQAHMQARYCILKVLLEAGGGLLELKGEGENMLLALDRS